MKSVPVGALSVSAMTIIRFEDSVIPETANNYRALDVGTISTCRDRVDRNGIDGFRFHPTFTRDGKLRKGHEFLLEKPAQRAPWEEKA